MTFVNHLHAGLGYRSLLTVGAHFINAQSHDDPYALLELSLVLQLKYQRDSALAVQAQALRQRRHYRLKAAHSAQPALKLLDVH